MKSRTASQGRFVVALAAGLTIAASAGAQQPSAFQKPAPSGPGGASAPGTKNSSNNIRRTPDGHPDFSGIWTFAISLPPGGLRRVTDGKATTARFDQSARHGIFENVKGALPWTEAPSYKPEFQDKVKYLSANESKLDGVFYCGRPGVPRIGSPRRIIQLRGEILFLYEDIAGDPYRIIPTDGRAHRADSNPSYYGDSVGRWEGDTLVVEATNFVTDSWFGEDGYLHSDAMRVVERFWLDGKNLVYQTTVYDPKVLTEPWTNYPHVIAPSDEPLAESPACKDEDGPRLLNLDHHQQR